MGVLHTPSRHTFECDGTQRVFPIPSLMISQDFVRIEIDGVLQSDRKQWDIVNNSLVFVLAPISGAILYVQVASDSESLGELGMIANVDILAKNITNVNKVANIDTDVTKVADINLDVSTIAGIALEIPIVSAISTDVTTVVSISSDVITVAGIETDVTKVANIDTDVTTVANNIVDVQNAEENAIIAKEEAWKAEAERLTAKSYATEPENDYVKIYTSNNDGTFTITDTTDYSSYHWERKATTLVTEGIIDDTTSSTGSTYSSNKIDVIVNTIEGDINTIEGGIDTIDNTTVKLTGDQTIEDVKTFNSDIVGNITGHASLDLPLTGGKMTGAITAIRETKVAMADNNIDLVTGNLFTKTISVATTLTISGALSNGNANSFILELTNGGTGIITWWSGMKWAGGTAPTLTTAGVDILGFYSHDGGTTWRGMLMAKDSK